MAKGLTYKQAGVNIDEANRFVGDIGRMLRRTHRTEVLQGLGGFGGCFALKKGRYKNPVLVSSADGVGTKVKIAVLADKHDTIGIDLVAMNVNDILAMGAEPLFFLDYIAAGKLDRKRLVSIVRGITEGCRRAGCALIGGETAEMPLMYKRNEYDLAGFCVGVVEKEKMITGSRIRPQDVLVGIASSGLHSNGFSLVHKIFSVRQIKTKAKELLVPTRIYAPAILSLLRKFDVHGVAHITGGAFHEKLMRIFPENSRVLLRRGSWFVPGIFRELQQRGKISEREMFRTFNMGIGMVVVLKKNDALKVQSQLRRFKLKSWVIGNVEKGKSGLRLM